MFMTELQGRPGKTYAFWYSPIVNQRIIRRRVLRIAYGVGNIHQTTDWQGHTNLITKPCEFWMLSTNTFYTQRMPIQLNVNRPTPFPRQNTVLVAQPVASSPHSDPLRIKQQNRSESNTCFGCITTNSPRFRQLPNHCSVKRSISETATLTNVPT